MITREFLEQHKAELLENKRGMENARGRLTADIHATEGAIQNCDFLISKIDKDMEIEKAAVKTPELAVVR